MSISQSNFIKKMTEDPFQPELDDYIHANIDARPLDMLRLIIKRQLCCLPYLRDNLANLDALDELDEFMELEVIDRTRVIAINMNNMSNTMSVLNYKYPGDNYCKTIVSQYISYIQESMQDCGWTFSIENSPECIVTIYNIYTHLFSETKPSAHTPFVNSIETTLKHFEKFTDAVQEDRNNNLHAATVEVLVCAIQKQDKAMIRSIVIQDKSLLTRINPLNNSIQEFGFTPLMYAAKYCNVDIIAEGIFVVLKGKKEISIYLCNKIKDKNSSYIGYDLVMIAGRWGKSDTFDYLLQFMTKRAVGECLNNLFKAITEPYAIKNREAQITLESIATLLTKESANDLLFEDMIKDFIFSDNLILLSKIRSLYTKLTASTSPTPMNETVADIISAPEVLNNRSALFVAIPDPIDTTEGSRYPSRKRNTPSPESMGGNKSRRL